MRRFGLLLVAALMLLGVVLISLWQALQPPRLRVPPQRDWVFENVTLVEPGRAARPSLTVRVVEGRIAEIDTTQSTARIIGESGTSDLAGLYVTPGLIDLHVHYPPTIAIGNSELWSLLLLAHGVTSVREMGSVDGSIFDVRRDVRAGRTPGPRIFACGAMLDGENPSFPSNRIVASRRQGKEAVVDLAARGADCIKVYNMLSREAFAGIRAAAAELGLPLVGHAPHSVSIEEAGISDLQHGTGVVVVDVEKVGRSDFRDADWETVDDERIATAARISREQDIAHTPTLVNARMRRLLVHGQPVEEAIARDTGLRHLPRYWPMAWQTIWGAPFAPEDLDGEARNALFRSRQARMTARLHASGVRIHAGTDTLMPFVAPGSSLHGELAELREAGIAPEEVWGIATRGAGLALGANGLGTLELGAPADLLFLRADPHGDLSALREIEAVLADGRLYRRADLEAMLAKTDAHFHGALYDGVMHAVVALIQKRFAPRHGGAHGFGEFHDL
jgi:imidazolonepropionase-like amidohydrolase